MKNDQNGITDWVHRNHIRKIYPRPPHLDDDSDDESENHPIISIHRENSDLDKSSSRGVELDNSHIIKNEVANDTVKTEADDSICSNQSQRQIVDENQLAKLFKKAAKSKRKSRQKSPTEPTRKSTRDKKQVEKLQIGSTKGQTYD